jgi:hypothetical protein
MPVNYIPDNTIHKIPNEKLTETELIEQHFKKPQIVEPVSMARVS